MNLPPLSKSCGGRTVLSLPALPLADGQIHAVIGANGSGKSTLVRLLAGVMPADGGVCPFPHGQRPAIGYMPQHSYPFQMSTRRNLLLTSGRAGGDRADRLLADLGLDHLSGQSARRLSGGETARMALARVLMGDWQLLLLDEPTAALDVEATLRAEQAVLDYRARTGCTVVWVTHSLKQAGRTADQVLFLQSGRLVEQGPADQVLRQPTQPETRAFLDFYSL